MTNSKFTSELDKKAHCVNKILQDILAGEGGIDENLKAPLRYTLEAPGKRIRSALVLWCCELVGGAANRDAEIAAAAVEIVHTYSLVHDDLPAMDDDDLRRGVPTCHKQFDEATAILTGDALLTLAFEILAKRIADPRVAVKLIARLAEDAGASGMIAGQVADLQAENTACDINILDHIHTNKTAKLFRCAAAMGAICGGADEVQFAGLCEYGLKIGLAFQIADDILDVSASSEQLGKTAGKDERASKCTYPAVVGIERARSIEERLTAEAASALAPFGAKANTLRELAGALLSRVK
ncbi:MAG: polyprenyl synthetase family protein [Sedimentisphaerales bacterium]|nr:polyprenyl synthetase family protein [Sedimentisphaerales bacterium]